MKSRFLIILIILLSGVCTSLFPYSVYAQSNLKFDINKFTVHIDRYAIVVSGRRPYYRTVRNITPDKLDGKTISGNGTISLRGEIVNVTFKNIRLIFTKSTELRLIAPHLLKNKLVATSGVVNGSIDNADYITYNKAMASVTIKLRSIKIAPKLTRATVLVDIPIRSVSSVMPILRMISKSGQFAPDGSIFSNTFHTSSIIPLSDLNYKLNIKYDDPQLIKLGAAFKDSSHNQDGIHLKGFASRKEQVSDAFFFEGFISDNLNTTINLHLHNPFTVYPETGYQLNIKQGDVKLTYTGDELLGVDGLFVADMMVPSSVVNETGSPIGQLLDVKLNTDSSDSLYSHNVTIPNKLRTGEKFIIEPEENTTWAYFSKWPTVSGYSDYPDSKEGPKCEDLNRFLEKRLTNVNKRPGLTVRKGIMVFDSPQITIRDKQTSVKTRFQGAMTLTPWGLSGSVQGDEISFVPKSSELSEGETSWAPARSTWQEILDKGNIQPDELPERFNLAGLRILDMQAKKIYFCKNELEDDKSIFNYIVHFPFPSYIHLKFEDKSLKKDGRFKIAEGPLTTTSNVDDIAVGGIPAGEKEPVIIHNPDTHILWAWRLPVSFADRNVKIRFTDTSPYNNSINVKRVKVPNYGSRISSSELWLKPLYSKNSTIMSGVRFGAIMNSYDGKFILEDIDRNPILASQYAKPGTELSVGFDVKLNDLSHGGFKREEITSNPVTRGFDFGWRGRIQFPFFSGVEVGSWKDVSFEIKDLEPKLLYKLQMSSTNNSAKCATAESGCAPTLGDNVPLRVDVQQLDFDAKENSFNSGYVDAFEIIDDSVPNDLHATLINIYSYTDGLVTTTDTNLDDYPIPNIGSGDEPGADCSREPARWVRGVLRNPKPKEQFKDLTCYDSLAICATGICSNSCVRNYMIGTFELASRTCEDLDAADCMEKPLISIPRAKYYLDSNELDVKHSNVSVKSDEMDDETHNILINVPSGNLEFSEDGRYVHGAFGATRTEIATSLPYEGEFRVKLDTHCGYYYLFGAGSFTYYLRFSGQNLIIHSPYKFLTESNNLIGVTPIIETLRRRALFDSTADFTRATGLNTVSKATVISGMFTSGNVSWGQDIGIGRFNAELGPGAYVFQFKNGEEKKYRIGTFVNALAEAWVGIEFKGVDIGVGVSGDTSLTGALETRSLTNLNNFISSGRFVAEGRMKLNGCGSVKIAYCDADLSFSAGYSSGSGLNVDLPPSLKSSCGRGKC